MHKITFPGLNLEFNISKIAIKLGTTQIYWYAIIIVGAIIIGTILAKKDDGKYNVKFETILDLLIYLIPISLLFARIYYVLFNLTYYIQKPMQIINITNGGLAIYGAIIGGLITTYVFCKKRKLNILDILDYIVPYLALGQAIGRWGNFTNIEAYGVQTNIWCRMGIIENSKYIEVHPTFLYESICTFTIFILLTILQNKRKYKGEITYIYLITYSFARAFIENLRTDSLMLFNVRISQIISIFIFVVFLSILIYKTIKSKKTKTDDKKQKIM